MARQAAAATGLQPPRLEIHLVVDDQHRVGLELVEARGRADGTARLVHERLGLQQRNSMAVQS